MAGVNFEFFRQPCDSDIIASHTLWLAETAGKRSAAGNSLAHLRALFHHEAVINNIRKCLTLNQLPRMDSNHDKVIQSHLSLA